MAIHNVATWSAELLLALHRETAVEDRPLPLLVEEAGGRITDLTGVPLLSGNGTILATNGLVHDELLDLVRGLPTGRDYESLRQ